MNNLLALSLFFCSCLAPLSPDRILEDVIYDEWKIAQSNLECLNFPASEIEPTQFRWSRRIGPFKCGSALANGCFSADSRRISWNALTPNVIRHEAGHAILWLLNRRPLWKCYEHSEKEWCPIELTRECKNEN